jgi:hypothetical protein
MTPSRLPYGSHQLQVNIYAYLLRQLGREVNRLFIQYVDMSGPTKCRKCNVPVERIDGNNVCPKCLSAPREAHLGALLIEIPMMDDEEVKSHIETRVGVLRGAMDSGAIPEGEPGFLCNYCPSLLLCPEGMSYV